MKKQYRSDIAASVHETAEGLYEVGLMDKRTMREFDDLSLTKIRPLTADEIRNIRERENISQVVFAHYLNVTKGVISQWERGENFFGEKWSAQILALRCVHVGSVYI